ncbi:MAG TPA: hypothetical protein ENI38_00195 [Candidatus Acetothermia bacterium]|nr:hypothetical protein [Candidatus Acetothermia bacterium]
MSRMVAFPSFLFLFLWEGYHAFSPDTLRGTLPPIIKNWPKGVEIYVLFLLAYELTSVARKKILRHPQPKEKGFEALEIGLSLDINWT